MTSNRERAERLAWPWIGSIAMPIVTFAVYYMKSEGEDKDE